MSSPAGSEFSVQAYLCPQQELSFWVGKFVPVDSVRSWVTKPCQALLFTGCNPWKVKGQICVPQSPEKRMCPPAQYEARLSSTRFISWTLHVGDGRSSRLVQSWQRHCWWLTFSRPQRRSFSESTLLIMTAVEAVEKSVTNTLSQGHTTIANMYQLS